MRSFPTTPLWRLHGLKPGEQRWALRKRPGGCPRLLGLPGCRCPPSSKHKLSIPLPPPASCHRGQANLKPLLQQLTYGRPPWQRKRMALEEPAAELPAALPQQPAAHLSAAARPGGRGAAEQLSADASIARLGAVQASSAGSQAAAAAGDSDAALLVAAQAAEAALWYGGESAPQLPPSTPLAGEPQWWQEQRFGWCQQHLRACVPMRHCPIPSSPPASAGGVARCAGALALVAGLAWLVARRSRSSAQGLPAGPMHHGHRQSPSSLIPGVRERFHLSEVIEQTGGWLHIAAVRVSC